MARRVWARSCLLALTTLAALGLASTSAFAQQASSSSANMPQLVSTINVPGKAGRWDLMQIDPKARRLYLANTSNESFDVMDLTNQSFLAQIKGLPSKLDAQNTWHGANGLDIAPELGKAWVADEVDNAVHIYDTNSLTQGAVVPTDQEGSDSVAYDPIDKKVFVSNGDSQSIVVLDPVSNKIMDKIELPGSPELAAWDPFDHTLHQNISDLNGSW
jgi:YVTN family beta-propeller protein